MFRKIVSNLSLSPAANSQLTFYWKRLRQEQLTRQLSMVMAIALAGLQVATVIAPPDAATASSSNDVISGGINVSKFSWPRGVAHQCDSQWPQKNFLIYNYLTKPDVRALFNKQGITEADLCKTDPATVSPSREVFNRLYSYGRNPHNPALDRRLTAGGKTFYARPLSSWGSATYKVLEGRRAVDGKYFAILYNCGNLAVTDLTPEAETIGTATPGTGTLVTSGNVGFATPVFVPAPTPTPTPTPVPAPEPEVKVVQPPPPPPTTPTPPTPPQLKKTGTIIAPNGAKRDAHGAMAQAGEVIEYQLTTTNVGSVDNKDYVVSDNLLDTLEYADVISAGKGAIVEGIMSWPKIDIKPGQAYVVNYQVRIKSPIPSRPTSASDPLSYDLRMDDVYGNLVSTTLTVPSVAKQVEVASAQLPQTGPGTNTAIVLTIAGLIVFFYFRSRQLSTEVAILRTDHHGHGGHR